MLSIEFIPVFCLLISQYAAAPAEDSGNVQPIPHPTLTADLGWQYGRTLAECNQYMLDHQLATDIGFLVGPRGQAKSLIRAHRYVLLSRSDIFTKLLMQNNAIDKDLLPASSNTNVTLPFGHPMTTIEIPDMNPAVFRQMLNFIYTDNATLDLRNVIPLMYAAKKYQLPNLMHECQRALQHNISLDNVCIILNQAVYFKEEQLINTSLALIGRNAEQVMNSQGFEQLTHAALKAVISYGGLDANETFIFERCTHWAVYQISTKTNNLTADTDMIRKTLDGIIYHIRFPLMEQKEFAELVGTSDLLTCSEKASIYYYIATLDHMNSSLGFDWKKRNRTRILERFQSFSNNWGCGRTTEKIQFMVTKAITLKGIGTYHVGKTHPHYNQYIQPSPGETFRFSVAITRNNVKYETVRNNEIPVGRTQSFTFNYTGQGRDFVIEIPLDAEIQIQPNYYYVISLNLLSSASCFPGHGTNGRGNPLQGEDGVSFTFNAAGTSTNANQGQIPRIYYSM